MNTQSNSQKEMTLRTVSSIFGDEEVTVEKRNVEIAGKEITFSIIFDMTVRELAILAADYAVVRKVQAGTKILPNDKEDTITRKKENLEELTKVLSENGNKIRMSQVFDIFGERKERRTGIKKEQKALEVLSEKAGVQITPEMFTAMLQMLQQTQQTQQ